MKKEISKEELAAFIKEALEETALANQLSAEDEEYDEADFEDSLGVGSEDYYDDDNFGLDDIDAMPLSAVDMPIQDKAILRQGGDESYDDEFSDLNGYREFGDGNDDYEGNWQDDVSMSPGYYNENKIKLTIGELQKLIKEGVEKIHKKTLIENRLEQINKELNALNNPEAWEDARNEAQAQLRKKNIAWTNLTQKERLVSENSAPKRPIVKQEPNPEVGPESQKPKRPLVKQEPNPESTPEPKKPKRPLVKQEKNVDENKYSDKASNFIGKEIGHLQKDKGYAHDRAVAAAINIAKDKGYKVPSNESSDNKKISLEKLITLAKNAGDIIKDAESELNSLGIAYGEGGIPLSRVMEILDNYDIEFSEVNKKRAPEKEKWMSIEDMMNRGLLEKDLNEAIKRANKLIEQANKMISKKK